MVKNADKLVAFDDKLTQLETTLCILKRTLDMYRIVSLNRTKIKRIGGVGQFFAHVRRASLESLLLGIFRIFENPDRKKHDLHSLPGVLCAAETLPVRDPEPLWDFLRRYTSDDTQREGDVTNVTLREIKEIYARFRSQHNGEFVQMRTVRNKLIAHAEYIEEDAGPRRLPSYDCMERLLLFAVDMQATLLMAYVHVHAHRIADDGLATRSTCALLKKLGIQDVKTQFDDDE